MATTPNPNTPNGVICDGMRDAGLLQAGNVPTSEQYVQYSRNLIDVIKYMQTQGLKLWLNVDTAVPLVAGQNSYTFKPSGNVDMTKPMRVLQGYYYTTVGGTRRPITVLSWQEWLQLSNVTEEGSVSQYFVDKQQSQLTVYFWLTPDSTAASEGVAHVLLQTQVASFNELDETMNFPEEWRMALRWGLAADICTGQPEAIVQRCNQRAEFFRNALENWDVEDAPTQFQVDQRFYTGVIGNFK